MKMTDNVPATSSTDDSFFPETPKEEREKWLRCVHIESVSSDQSTAAALGSLSIVQQLQQLGQQNTPTQEDDQSDDLITFVYIPQDDAIPLANLFLPYDFRAAHPVGDAIPEYVQAFFADSKPMDAELLKMSTDALQAVTAQGSVETFPLVHPAETNDYCGVYLYLDEFGPLRDLPLNKRASELAATCGSQTPAAAPKLLYGDVFVGRVQTKPVTTNLPFQTPRDTCASAAWMQQAAVDNAAWQEEAMNLATTTTTTGKSTDAEILQRAAAAENIAWQQQAMNLASTTPETTTTGKSTETIPPKVAVSTQEKTAAEKAYEWTQTKEDIELRISSCKLQEQKWHKPNVQVQFKPKSIQVRHLGEMVVHLPRLYAPVDVDGCVWTLDDDHKTLVITCEKAEAYMWPRIEFR